MQRIAYIERLGARVAAMSDLDDGDCGYGSGDCAARDAYLRKLSIAPERLVTARQVHGATVFTTQEAIAAGAMEGQGRPDADALITTDPSVAIGVFVADCVPVWLYAPSARVGALIHAGRHGILLGIAGITAAALLKQAAGQPHQLHAWIGPSAGPCCYEVSEAVALEAEAAGVIRRGRYLDLWATNKAQLMSIGVPPEQIGNSEDCTICSGRYHSYRAQATRARNLSVLQL